MNRSLLNVLFGAFGTGGGAVVAGAAGEQNVRTINAEDAAVLMAYGKSVIIVPGYGMAVAQAQTPFASSWISSSPGAWTSSSPSTRSPAGCRAT